MSHMQSRFVVEQHEPDGRIVSWNCHDYVDGSYVNYGSEWAIDYAQKLWQELPSAKMATTHFVIRNQLSRNIIAIIAGVRMANVVIVEWRM